MRRRSAPMIDLRCDVGPDPQMQMVALSFGVAIITELVSAMIWPGVAFRPFHDEPEPIQLSDPWSA